MTAFVMWEQHTLPLVGRTTRSVSPRTIKYLARITVATSQSLMIARDDIKPRLNL